MSISLILTPFDHFHICPTFAVTPNLILEPCHIGVHKIIFRYPCSETCDSLHFIICIKYQNYSYKYLLYLTTLSLAAKSISVFIEIDLPIAGQFHAGLHFQMTFIHTFEDFSNISEKFFILPAPQLSQGLYCEDVNVNDFWQLRHQLQHNCII